MVKNPFKIDVIRFGGSPGKFINGYRGSRPTNLIQNKRNPASSAFTLVELVVTVGITAILATLLVDSLASGRSKAKRVKCQGVLHQVYLTTILYAQDNEGLLPPLPLIFQAESTAPTCPGADSQIRPIERGGYYWSPTAFGPTNLTPHRVQLEPRLDAHDPKMWMIFDVIPWHDSRRQRDPVHQVWAGLHNFLHYDGSIDYKYARSNE